MACDVKIAIGKRSTRSSATYGGTEMYSSLEAAHVAALSNLIERPVIVVANKFVLDDNGAKIAPNHLRGNLHD